MASFLPDAFRQDEPTEARAWGSSLRGADVHQLGTSKTTISGKIYDPAGKIPLYNVVVYVPNAPVVPFTEGASCDRCGASIVNPVTSAITDETGNFVLDGCAGRC